MSFELIIGADPLAATIAITVLCVTFLVFLRMRYKRKSGQETMSAIPKSIEEPTEDAPIKSKETVRLEQER